jgi:hypothetical protein
MSATTWLFSLSSSRLMKEYIIEDIAVPYAAAIQLIDRLDDSPLASTRCGFVSCGRSQCM